MTKHRINKSLLWSFLLVAAPAGCSDVILASDFDQSCTADADCVTVLVGDICECGCESGAINKRDLEKYREERGDISCSTSCEFCPEQDPAVCKAGVCSVQ